MRQKALMVIKNELVEAWIAKRRAVEELKNARTDREISDDYFYSNGGYAAWTDAINAAEREEQKAWAAMNQPDAVEVLTIATE